MSFLENGDYPGSEDPSYWSHLGNLGIRGIEFERNRIKSEKESLSAGTRALAFENYRTFIEASQCGRDVAKHLNEAKSHAEKGLSEKLPLLRLACSEFESKANEISGRRKKTSLVLSKHTRLLEVLELPQLAETCVRNGHYEEALDLKQYVTRLNKKLGHIPIVREVVESVLVACNAMLNQLLAQLRAPITLPTCLKVVGYLRRMDVYGETELRLRFLQARDSWLTGLLRLVPNDNPYDHLTKSMELTRVHLFDIVTQYRALFSDDDPLLASPTVSHASNRLLFSSWLEKKIDDFLEVLKADLDKGAKKQSLDSIIGQAMYFGQSFGRIGADFRLSLVPIFTSCIREVTLSQLKGAEEKFKTGIYHLAFKAAISKSRDETGSLQSDYSQPPVTLLEFSPLAELCNQILCALNELRLMAPLSLGPEIVARIQETLERSALILKDRQSQFKLSTTDTERSSFQRLLVLFSNDLLVYIDSCLFKLFPPESMLQLQPLKVSLDIPKVREILPEHRITPASKIPNEIPSEISIDEKPDPEFQKHPSLYVADRTELISQEIDTTLKAT